MVYLDYTEAINRQVCLIRGPKYRFLWILGILFRENFWKFHQGKFSSGLPWAPAEFPREALLAAQGFAGSQCALITPSKHRYCLNIAHNGSIVYSLPEFVHNSMCIPLLQGKSISKLALTREFLQRLLAGWLVGWMPKSTVSTPSTESTMLQNCF